MGFGIKIGGLSLNKVIDVNQVTELALKTSVPLNNLAVCTKLAESLFYGVLRKNSIERNFPATKITSPEIRQPLSFTIK